MFLKDCGRSAEEISQYTGVSKSNVEKWCSDKLRDKLVEKYLQQSPAYAAALSGCLLIDTVTNSQTAHFDTREREKQRRVQAFLWDRLRAQSNDACVDLSRVEAILPLPLSAMGPPVTLVPQLPLDSWDVFTSDAQSPSGPAFKKKKDGYTGVSANGSVSGSLGVMDGDLEALSVLGTPFSLNSGSVPVVDFDTDQHSVASILAYGIGRDRERDRERGNKGERDDDAIAEGEREDEDEIMSELEVQMRQRQSSRLVTTKTFCPTAAITSATSNSTPGCIPGVPTFGGTSGGSLSTVSTSNAPSALMTDFLKEKLAQAPAKHALHPHIISEVTMQYNDCVTWNMDALLQAATIVENMHSSNPSDVTGNEVSAVSHTTNATTTAAVPSVSVPESVGSADAVSATSSCSEKTVLRSTLSLQEQRPVLSNTKYLTAKKEEQAAKERERLRSISTATTSNTPCAVSVPAYPSTASTTSSLTGSTSTGRSPVRASQGSTTQSRGRQGQSRGNSGNCEEEAEEVLRLLGE